MSDIKQELDKIRGRISEPSFLKNEGLSNEVGIHLLSAITLQILLTQRLLAVQV